MSSHPSVLFASLHKDRLPRILLQHRYLPSLRYVTYQLTKCPAQTKIVSAVRTDTGGRILARAVGRGANPTPSGHPLSNDKLPSFRTSRSRYLDFNKSFLRRTVSFIPSACAFDHRKSQNAGNPAARPPPLSYFPTVEWRSKKSNDEEETQMIPSRERNANIVKLKYEVSVVPRFSGEEASHLPGDPLSKWSKVQMRSCFFRRTGQG